MGNILVIDQGTSSTRTILFDTSGRILASAAQAIDMSFPADGWVEQDPEVLWQTSLATARKALKQASMSAEQVSAIGITNQRETTLVWERATGTCVHPAIVWQDRRTAQRCATLAATAFATELIETTGLLIDPYFSATKLEWLLANVPGAQVAAQRNELCFGTVDSFLIWRFTKGKRHVTDATNASRTALFDLQRQQWSPELLSKFGVPGEMMPEVLDSAAEFGVAHEDWLGAPIPIFGVAGDQQAALVGQGCFTPGSSKCTYGTGCFAMTNTGTQQLRSSQQLLTTLAYRIDGQPTFALEGSVFAAGVAVKWLRDKLQLIDDPADTEAIAQRIGYDTGGVYVVPAFTGLGAPYWDPTARGTITGLTLDSNRDHLIAATLQSVVYQTVDLLNAMMADKAAVASLRVDGGMVVNDWLCQCIADMTGLRVERPEVTETTALGAAVLAAVGAGEISSIKAASAMWRADRTFTPQLEPSERSRLYAGWQQAVTQARVSSG